MPDLLDGESVEIQGSARTPYVLKNVGGVYTCSCPAWKYQSAPIDRRSCKHIVRVRGLEAENQRIGHDLSSKPQTKKLCEKHVPPLLLAHPWDDNINPTGFWMSEKLDGVRCYFDGSRFWSRNGNVYHAPAWFKASLPTIPLDGELWLDRKTFQQTVSIVRRHDQTDEWKRIRYVIFDAPSVDGPFETRQAFLQATLHDNNPAFARVLEQERCTGLSHLQESLATIEARGGEGVMLRQPSSAYEAGRSAILLKVKSFHELDVRVVEHLPGTGRHRGRLGALAVELPNGKHFSVGTGFTDSQRNSPPLIGTFVTVRYQELTDAGIPRFPSFVRVRSDLA